MPGVLLLALHNVSEPSAKVPFCMMALLDAVKKRQTPPELRCRQVFPTNGSKMTSLWDAPSAEALQAWLDEFLSSSECSTDVFEVQEQFAFGISAELARARAAERVTANTRAAAGAVQERTQRAAADAQQRMGEIDAKLKVSEHAAAAYKTARDTSQAAAKRTAELLGRAGISMENERVAAAATAINSNVAAGWRSLSSGLGSLYKGSTGTSSAAATPPDTPTGQPARAVPPANGGSTAPSPAKPAPAPAPRQQPEPAKPQGGGSLFTLDDLEADAPAGKH